MSFRRDRRGFIFSLDATLAMLIMIIVMAGVARVSGPEMVYGQHGYLRLERYANDALTVMDTLDILENIVRDVEYGDTASAENTARAWLRKILPEDVQFKLVFGDDLLTAYPTDAPGWSSAFSAAGEVATAVRMATYWDGTHWSTQIIDSTGNTGQYTSIALDSSGYPHISYYDDTTDNLMYARWTGFDWAIWAVQKTGDVGKYTSIALDNRGYAHISYYYDSTFPASRALRYVYWDGNGWVFSSVDRNNVGQYTSIALDNNGRARISYYDQGNQRLKYARWTGAAWNIQIVDDSANNVGQYTSLALDENWNPHISYYDVTNRNLKYARWTGSSWSIQTVDSSVNDVGQYTSIALDSSWRPHISYYDDSNKDLKYARWTGSAWDIQTVDSAGFVGMYTSIDLDGNDNPHIAYFDDTADDLKYAWWNGNSWRTITVDSQGDVGTYTSMALVARGYPHISYYDGTNGDLKYARSLWDFVPITLYVWRGSSI